VCVAVCCSVLQCRGGGCVVCVLQCVVVCCRGGVVAGYIVSEDVLLQDILYRILARKIDTWQCRGGGE